MKKVWIIGWRIIVAIGMVSLTVLVAIIVYRFYDESDLRYRHGKYVEGQCYNDDYVYVTKNHHIRTRDCNGKYLTPKLD